MDIRWKMNIRGHVMCIHFLSSQIYVRFPKWQETFFITTDFEIKHCIIWGDKPVKEIFTSVFHNIEECEVELKAMRFDIGGLDTHRLRKGVETMLSYGWTVFPTITFLFIRCGWSMRGSKVRYLNYEASGYQYIGRCTSSLDQNQNCLHALHIYLFLVYWNFTGRSC